MRSDHSVGGDVREAEPASRRQCFVPPFAWPQLGIQVLWAAETKRLLEKGNVAGEEDETFAVLRKKVGQADRRADGPITGCPTVRPSARPPVYCCNCTTQCSPAPVVHRERHYLLTTSNQMGAKYRTHTGGITGVMELDRSVHTVSVGAGKRTEPPLRRGVSESLRAGGAKAKGKVGMGV